MTCRLKPFFFFLLVCFVWISAAAAADDRGLVFSKGNKTALVIGNGTYASAPLKNPVNDARDMAAMLRKKGFDTDLIIDGSQRDMERAIRDFGKKIMKGGTGLFYYAGHGMQVNGVNYLIPIGADIMAEDEIKYESVNVNMVLSKMEAAGNNLNMIFLDACRNNPFARSFRSGNTGLAQMDVTRGAVIAFATSPGNTAADGDGRNGVFTKHLLAHMDTPGLELSRMLKKVRKDVRLETQNMQVPWDVSSLEGDFYFSPSGPSPAPPPVKTASPDVPASRPFGDPDQETWDLVKQSTYAEDYAYYLKQFPDGRYSTPARLRMRQLSRTEEPPPRKPETVQIPMNLSHWEKMESRNPRADVDEYDRMLRLRGAAWTNGRKDKNGHVDGNGMVTREVYDLNGRTFRAKFKMNSPGKYSAVSVKPTAMPIAHVTTNNSWAGSFVIQSDTWYYIRARVTDEGWWESVLCTENYDDKSGRVAQRQGGKLTDKQVKALSRSSLTANFGDNYAGTSAFLYLAEMSIE
ncbi:hypothetical protein JCM14469_02020 [Desulfatiferula olefinivorans]